jgi:hypothetical protein
VHNLEKSEDDEYFRFIIGMSFSGRMSANEEVYATLIRASSFNPRAYRRFLDQGKETYISHPESGEPISGIAIPIEFDRFHSVLFHIARGVFFSNYGTRFVGEIRIVYDGTNVTNFSQDHFVWEQKSKMHATFESVGFFGTNPKNFRYAFHQKGNEYYLGMDFYEHYFVVVKLSEV